MREGWNGLDVKPVGFISGDGGGGIEEWGGTSLTRLRPTAPP